MTEIKRNQHEDKDNGIFFPLKAKIFYRKFYSVLIFISGLLLFVFTLFVAYKELSPEWKNYQAEYKELLIKKAKDGAVKVIARSLDFKIPQIYLGSRKKVDRCTSCHMGVENPLMVNVPIVYKQHSGDYLEDHPADRFGCTICHNGQGRATSTKEAHGTGRDIYWDYPIIPFKYIQSSCAQCHDFEMLKQNGAEIVAEGEKLFRERGCKGCHKLNGVGGLLGKALDNIGSQPFAYFPMRYVKGERTVYSWHRQHFADPRNMVPESEMRAFLNDEESDFLTTYILTLKSEDQKFICIRQSRKEVMDGESLYKMYCIACHTTGKYSVYDEIFKRTIPAVMNPAFLKTVDNKLLKKIIEEGRGQTPMTAWKADAAGLADGEINRIIKYITRNRPKEKPEPFQFSKFKGNIGQGEELFKVRCARCHGAEGEGGEDFLGISLKNPVVEKEADPEFIAITIRDGRKGTPMAAFGKNGVGLEDQTIVDIVTYVRALSSEK